MIRNRLVLFLALALAAPVFGGCAANNNVPPGVEVPDGARLEVVGSRLRTISEYSEELLEVRYVQADGTPIDGIVDFNIENDPMGATLSGMASPTDEGGIASITIRASREASFDVVASAPGADPVSVAIEVQPMRFGDLSYTVTYGGDRLVDDAEVALFTNITCTALSETVPAPRASQETRLFATQTFEDVEVGVPLAVFALGIDRNDNVAAEACADVTLEDTSGSVEIALDDVAELFGGTYDIRETFDVTEGFHPTLNLLLDVMTGLATDPALFIVDFVAAHDSTPGWLKTVLGSSITRNLVAGYLRDALENIHVPGFLMDVFELGHGIDLAFGQLTFDGQLIFPEPDEFGAGEGVHRVTRLSFPTVGGGTAERPLSQSADVQVQVGPTIAVSEHQIALAFGDVVEMVLHDVLLPTLPGAPRTTSEFLGNLLDCDAIAASIGSGTTEDIANAVCDVGLTLLGGVIEGYVTNLWQYDTMTLSGTADLTDSDTDYDRDLLENGQADALWTGPSGEMSFNGVFSGSRPDDINGRQHEVRDRMNLLR